MPAAKNLQTQPWTTLFARIRMEYAALPVNEKLWLDKQAEVIAACQETLDGLFLSVGGMASCRNCDGACCGSGRHHLTLANLLDFLRSGQEPPIPDFECSCPFLGVAGCRLPVRNRPYNCITFFCEALDEQFSTEQGQLLKQTDQTLRATYQAIANRFPIGSLRGLWLASERLGDQPLFVMPDRAW
jgi:hypothetical protein